MLKTQKLFLVNLKLFDGEEGAASQGNGTGTQEQAASNTSVNGQQTQEGAAKKIEPVVIYGKQSGQQDNQTQKKDPSTQGQGGNQPFKVFNTKEEFQKEFDKVIGERLKKQRETEETLRSELNKVKPFLEIAMQYHGINDPEAALKRIADDYLAELAERANMPLDTYKDYTQLKKKDAERSEAEKARQEKEEMDRKAAQWWEEGTKFAEELKKDNPNLEFDMVKETQNPQFVHYLVAGLSVKDAYFLVHKDDIIKNTAQQIEKNVAESIKAGAGRIVENGTQNNAPVIIKSDVTKLTPEDREKAVQEAMGGKQVIW